MKPQKSVDFNNYKMKILKKLMEICLIYRNWSIINNGKSWGQIYNFSSTKNAKIFIGKYLINNYNYDITEKYNLKDVTIIYLIFLV